MAGGDRSQADSLILAALLGGATVAAAGETAKVSEATVYRRLRDPDFRAQLDQGRREIVVAAIAQLASLLEVAVSVQRELLTSNETPAAVRRSIANDVEHAIGELAQARDVEERLEQIEQRLGLDELGRLRQDAA